MTKKAKKHINDGMGIGGRFCKRSFDICGSCIGLLLTSPIFLAIAIAQKIEGEGPVFFRQERVGKDGKTFNILKFRTMKTTAEDDGPQLAHECDDRLTKVGKFLRLHHIDELPQLWNVFIGDMSFVGYRPERQYFIDQIIKQRPDYTELYISRPGVTSDATLHNGYTNTIEKMIMRLDMDLNYLHTRNIAIDCKIIGETLAKVICGQKF